jgi:ABC-type amino acid transport substrate-binding protein
MLTGVCMPRRMVIVSAAVLALASLTGCGSNSPSDRGNGTGALRFSPRAAGVLTVSATLGDLPFVVSRDLERIDSVTNQAQGPGYEVEMVDEVASRLGLTVRWKRAGDSERAAQCGCDVVLGSMRATSGVGRTSSPYFRDRQAVMVRKGTDLREVPLATLRVGAVSGSAGLAFAQSVIVPDIEPSGFASIEALTHALRVGDIDATATDIDSALTQVATPDSNLSVAGQYIGAESRSATVLGPSENRVVLSALIDQLTQEGFFDQLRAKYFPSSIALPLRTLPR